MVELRHEIIFVSDLAGSQETADMPKGVYESLVRGKLGGEQRVAVLPMLCLSTPQVDAEALNQKRLGSVDYYTKKKSRCECLDDPKGCFDFIESAGSKCSRGDGQLGIRIYVESQSETCCNDRLQQY